MSKSLEKTFYKTQNSFIQYKTLIDSNNFGIIHKFFYFDNKTYILNEELRSSAKNSLTHNGPVMKNADYDNYFSIF